MGHVSLSCQKISSASTASGQWIQANRKGSVVRPLLAKTTKKDIPSLLLPAKVNSVCCFLIRHIQSSSDGDSFRWVAPLFTASSVGAGRAPGQPSDQSALDHRPGLPPVCDVTDMTPSARPARRDVTSRRVRPAGDGLASAAPFHHSGAVVAVTTRRRLDSFNPRRHRPFRILPRQRGGVRPPCRFAPD